MSAKLSESEKIVIREIFKNPHISLVEIAKILEDAVHRRTSKKDVDVRTVSKFKSVGLKKIRKGLEDLAEALRLDRTIQGSTKEELERERNKIDILFRNGILSGYDYRIDREVYLFYIAKDHIILPWQDHLCNRNCENECKAILEDIRNEHGLDMLKKNDDIRNKFKITINEIYKRTLDEE